MSKRRDLETQIRSLNEIKEIMTAMKNLSLMEMHRLSRFLDTQCRVVASVGSAAGDFLYFYPHLFSPEEEFRDVYLLVGSERGFCGDFNECLLRAFDDRAGAVGEATLVVIGNKLAAKLADDRRVAAFLEGAGVVEEVEPVLVKLMEALSGLNVPRAPIGPLRLTVFHHRADEEHVQVSVLRPFKKPDSGGGLRFPHAPLINLEPPVFLTVLAEQYLFAALHELLYSSLMAENQRRMMHMDSAVRRLERTSTELLRRRNILRQEEITDEIEVIMLSVQALE